MVKKGKDKDIKKRLLRGNLLPVGCRKRIDTEAVMKDCEDLCNTYKFFIIVRKTYQFLRAGATKREAIEASSDGLGRFTIRHLTEPNMGKLMPDPKDYNRYSREIVIIEGGYPATARLFSVHTTRDLKPGFYKYTVNEIDSLLDSDEFTDGLRGMLLGMARLKNICDLEAENTKLQKMVDRLYKESNWYSKGYIDRHRASLRVDLKKIAKNGINDIENEYPKLISTKRDGYAIKILKY